jgi:peptidoglycan/LPS O-acetylase OafA/YrhL
VNKRLEQLDSIRGLAALSVFFHHIWLAYPLLPIVFTYSPARIFIGGHQAVIMFFILSGFCLSLPFLSTGPPRYISYLIKRVFRIYIPYLVSIVITIILAHHFHNKDLGQIRDFFHSFWQSGFDIQLIIAHLTLLGNFNSYAFNTVVWSLIHEMRVSIFFPLLMLFVINRGIGFNLSLCLGLNLLNALNDVFHFEISKGFYTSYFDTLYYTSFFIIGALAAKHRVILIEGYLKLQKRYKWILLTAAVTLYAYSRVWSIIRFAPLNRMLDDYSIAIGAVIFIIMALSSKKIVQVLNRNSIAFLGKISYSLYLYHFMVFMVLTYTLTTLLPDWTIVMITLITSVLLATLSYFTVEKPSILLGKRIVNRMIRVQGR